ncbi:DDE-type integrase/transposase/recombinase [Blautia sp. MCC289]|nr:DDE-type integrase/transposase/recombinase [Blautia sp. MCC289]
MQKNELYRNNNSMIRVLEIKNNAVLVIDCINKTMPQWIGVSFFEDWTKCSDETLHEITGIELQDIKTVSPEDFKVAHQRYTMIAPIIMVLTDQDKKNEMIELISTNEKISKQTLRKYLCLYLVYQDISVLIPKTKNTDKQLSQDEKNIRWALNKFYFSFYKHSLKTAYTMMLKSKYCDINGELISTYPTFHQFRYFYRKYKTKQTCYISRNGLTNYQRNNRPLLGDGIQEFAKAPGMGMLDSTICDIYLINDAKEIIGRPILTVCIDAYSSLCCGYALTLEGGIYSIRQLMSNVVSDKQEWCKEHNISIKKEEWNSSKCPGILVTDQGTEYTSSTFEQLAELGIKIVNLPVYRPELKGSVEKFFSIIQDLFRPYLKGKGVINPDFQERGAHDYRKDACLTLEQFEKILIRCILFYNTQRVLNNFPYTDDMLENRIQPYANNIFQYGLSLDGVNLIDINKEQIELTLMPRTTGKFTRTGLIVNNVRYKNKNFSEQYLSNKEVSVAYNPDDSGYVWLINNGEYIKFVLIESRFQNKNFKEIEEMKSIKKDIIRSVASEDLQARIGLGAYIETIANNSNRSNSNLQDIGNNKIKEKQKIHKNYTEEVNTDE